MKELKVEIPEGYKIDKENSTFECIKFKKVDEPMTWERYIAERPNVSAYVVKLRAVSPHPLIDKWVAEFKIYHLMPYYGGCIAYDEWEDRKIDKYTIERTNNAIYKSVGTHVYRLLAFRTREHRDNFLKHNRDIVDDFLCI